MGAVIEPKISIEEFLGDFNLSPWHTLSIFFLKLFTDSYPEISDIKNSYQIFTQYYAHSVPSLFYLLSPLLNLNLIGPLSSSSIYFLVFGSFFGITRS